MPVWLQTTLSVVVVVLHVGAILVVLVGERRNPSATLAWLLSVILLPAVGIGFWLLFGQTRYRRIAARSDRASTALARVLEQHRVADKLAEEERFSDPRKELMIALADHMASTPTSGNNLVEPLINGAQSYRSMLQAIEGARDHIHVLFYIVQPDVAGESLRDRLAAKAREGVEVRVLVDALGSASLPVDFWEPLEAAGGKASQFQPLGRIVSRLFRFRNRDRIDFRNHRKILVVDGVVGFTGGINVGREYLGVSPERGYWRDTHIRIEGPAALSLQEAFARDWLAATEELLDDARYFPEPPQASEGADCGVSIIDSGPDFRWSPILYVYAQAIALARERVWITNPYFVPGPLMEAALVAAALRGADVQILVPRKGDSRLVDLAARWWFVGLMEAGVKIHVYERGFIHAKTMVVDDWLATIGSANMDMRSFHLNFELNAFVYSRAVAQQLADQFTFDLRDAREYAAPEPRLRNLPDRLASAIARLLSPML